MKYVVVVERWRSRWYYTARPSGRFLRNDLIHPVLSEAKRYSTKEFAERAAFKLAVRLIPHGEPCYVEAIADAEKWERRKKCK